MYDIANWEPALRLFVLLAFLSFAADRWLAPRWPSVGRWRDRLSAAPFQQRAQRLSGLLLFAIALGAQAALRDQPASRASLYLAASLGLLAAFSSLFGQRQQAEPSRLAARLELGPGQLWLLALAAAFTATATALSMNGQRFDTRASVAGLAWLVAIGLVGLGSQRPPGRDRPLGLGLGRRERYAILGLFVLALALRAHGLDQFPGDLSIDESGAGEFALRFAQGADRDLLGWGWFDFPALYFGIQSVSIIILGQTITALRITSVLAGAATVPVVYLLARALYGRSAALTAALLLTVSHHHLYWSRIGLNNVWDGLFGSLVALGIWWGWARDWRPGFILAGLALGLGQYFYAASHLMPFLLLVWALAALVADRARFRARFDGLLLSAYAATIVVLPLLVRSALEPHRLMAPAARQAAFGSQPGMEQLAEFGGSKAAFALHLMGRAAGGFTHIPLAGNFHSPGAPMLLAGTAALFLLSLAWMLVHLDLRGLLLLLPLVGTVLSAGFSLNQPASQRFVLAAPFVFIIAALPLARALDRSGHGAPRDRSNAAAAVLALLLLIAWGDLRQFFVVEARQPFPFGRSTSIGNRLAGFFAESPELERQIYFFSQPAFPYANIPKYLLPSEVRPTDVQEALPSSWDILRPEIETLFVFAPERAEELAEVRDRYPGGRAKRHRLVDGSLAFVSYTLPPADALPETPPSAP